MRIPATLLCATLLLPGCAARADSVDVAAPSAPVPLPEWRGIATPADAARLDVLADRRTAAVARLAPRQHAAAAAAVPGLGDPPLDHMQPTPGSYRCRLLRLGAAAGRTGWRAFPTFFCYIRGEDDGRFSFVKQTGSDLPAGWLYPDGDRRMVFLGARDGARYSGAPGRDLVGTLERTAPFRWRLTLADGPGVALYEITPVPLDGQPPG